MKASQVTPQPIVDEILYGCRSLSLHPQSNPDSPDGPWHAQCPICKSVSDLDERPLTITRNGHIRCQHGCDPEHIARLLDVDPAQEIEDNVSAQVAPEGAAKLLSIADLSQLPAPSWLIEGLVPVGFNVLFGPSNVGKSFLALDWSLCIASSLPWYGNAVDPGWVVYIVAEGVAGLYQRTRAWMHARGQQAPERIRFIPAAANFLDTEELDRIALGISTLPEPPRLIVVDTMARCMVGGDENSAKDVGRFIAGADELGHRFNSSRLTVHHTGKDGEDERGSSALRGAADAMLALKPDGASARLECVKMKDAAPFDPWRLHLETVLESCVLRCGTNPTAIAPAERQILEEVSAAFGTNYASSTGIREASGVPKSTFYRSLKSLEERGFIEPDSNGQRARYRLTPNGQQQLVPSSPTKSHETSPTSPTRPSLYGTVGLETNNGTNPNPTDNPTREATS